MDIKKEIGKKVKHYRNLHKLTAQELGKKIDVSIDTIYNCESGRKFSLDILIKIADELKIDLKSLFDFNKKSDNEKLLNEINNLCSGKSKKSLNAIIEVLQALSRYLD